MRTLQRPGGDDTPMRLVRGVTTPALAAGAVAISVNTLLLKAADWVHVDIGHGGLLKLLHQWVGPALAHLGLGRVWDSLPVPAVGTPGFKIGFHIVVGLAMAMVYGLLLEPLLTRTLPAATKGLLYALLVWLANAAIVLPALGQGFAGIHVLSVDGVLYFAFAHTMFFLLLALVYERLHPGTA